MLLKDLLLQTFFPPCVIVKNSKTLCQRPFAPLPTLLRKVYEFCLLTLYPILEDNGFQRFLFLFLKEWHLLLWLFCNR